MDLLGKKALRKLAAKSNDAVGSECSGFAQRMMAKMGWEKGQGLGKDKQGVTTYVKVAKKEDNGGLGQEKAVQAQVTDQWFFTSFDDALSSFKKLDKSKKKKRKKERGAPEGSDSAGLAASAEDMYQEMFKATGGARMGMRARASQKAKWERAEQGGHVVVESTIVTESVTVIVAPPASDAPEKKRKKRKGSQAAAEGGEVNGEGSLSPVACVDDEDDPSVTVAKARKKSKSRDHDAASAAGSLGDSSGVKTTVNKDEAKVRVPSDDSLAAVPAGVMGSGVGDEHAPKRKKHKRNKP